MTTAFAKTGPWRAFTGVFATAALGLTALLFGLVLVLDPYGLRTGPGRAPVPIMDLNQRYMYPQLARSRLYDSAVFGTSTVRLLDPEALDHAFGGRFVNLGLNAGTPWEQTRLAQLFLRFVPAPRMLVWGLDRTWCDPQASDPDHRLTFRTFPPWLYDDVRLNDWPELVNLKSLEIASRVALNRLGLQPARIRQDGFEVFTPPESHYDLARARLNLRTGDTESSLLTPPETAPGDVPTFPALDWLAETLARLPDRTRLVLVFPPLHVSAQAAAGTVAARDDTACKARALSIGRSHAATVIDFRIPSPLTTDDSRFWDRLHYRLPVAGQIAEDLRRAIGDGQDDPDRTYRVLSRPDGR